MFSRPMIADELGKAWAQRLERDLAEAQHMMAAPALFTPRRVAEVTAQLHVGEAFTAYWQTQAFDDFGLLLAARQICPECEGLGCPACDNGTIAKEGGVSDG